MRFRALARPTGTWLLIAVMGLSCRYASVAAQIPSGSPANSGALTLQGGLDIPTLYIYRGIVQEGDPKLTFMPFGDIGIRLSGSDGAVGSTRVDMGIWNSLNTGSSGTGGPLKALHYAEQFYATLTIGLPRHLTLTPGYLANSSPNRSYQTVREVNVKVAHFSRIAPYALVAFELSDTGQLDGGAKTGTYLEFGAGPTRGLPFWSAQLTVPIKVGVSLRDYYELFGSDLQYRDNRFGFFDIGGVITVPVSTLTSRFGQWNIHSGADVLTFGTTTTAFNRGNKRKTVVTLIGIGLTY